MARDIDFVRRKKVPLATNPTLQPTITPSAQDRPKSWVLLVLLVGLILAAGGIYWKFVSGTDSTVLDKANSPTDTEATANQSTAKTVIALYNAGAKSTSANQLIQKLRRLDYEVIDSGKSQFKYTKTQVWYTTGHLTDAQTVAALTSTKPTLQATTTAGGFDVLIYLAN